MEQEIKNWIKGAMKNLGIEATDFVVEHSTDKRFGDYSTNVALKYSNPEEKNQLSFEIAIREELFKTKLIEVEKIVIAPRGFINFYLSRKFFTDSIETILNEGTNVGKNKTLDGQKIMVEYTDPNPFKPFHIGHLMTNAIGESIARILEHSGADVARANYQGDVGLHVAKAIWGLLKKGLPEEHFSNTEKAKYIGACYSFGSGEYESDPKTKEEIDEINKKIYTRDDKKINDIYSLGFDITMEAFEDLYRMLGTKFDFYFLESAMADIGRGIVSDNMGKVFEESEGAVVFKAEKYDPKLHTRVFITSQNLPTYETKELGLTTEKFKTDPDMNLSIVVTANEQMEYMRVVAKAISLIYPNFENRMKHITHGMMRFAFGKMGSRKGNVITGESLLNDARDSILEKMTDREFSNEEREKVASDVGVAAIKYSVLKQNIGGDIIYDFEKSISVDGDSGPYLQYSYARANSVLEKAQKEDILPDPHTFPSETFEVEKLLYKFGEVVLRSSKEYEPHYIANYLIEVARAYNSFYGNNMIVDKADKASSYKVALTYAFSFVMKTGLHLLGIEAPKKM
jgi:arginyl-tRNA synthetase